MMRIDARMHFQVRYLPVWPYKITISRIAAELLTDKTYWLSMDELHAGPIDTEIHKILHEGAGGTSCRELSAMIHFA